MAKNIIFSTKTINLCDAVIVACQGESAELIAQQLKGQLRRGDKHAALTAKLLPYWEGTIPRKDLAVALKKRGDHHVRLLTEKAQLVAKLRKAIEKSVREAKQADTSRLSV